MYSRFSFGSKFLSFALLILLSSALSSCSMVQDYLGLSPSEGSFVPQGEYVGAWKAVGENIKDSANKTVKVTLFPMKTSETKSSGTLMINDSSSRFYWRANGNKEDTWNILFAKDNNIYTDLTTDFSFNGILKKMATGLELSGSLKTVENNEIFKYFISTYRHFKPEILEPKEPPAAAAGEEISLEGSYFGEDKEHLVVKLISKTDSKELELKPSSIEEGEPSKFSFKVSKDAAKGDYGLYVIRDEEFQSNTVTISVK